MMNFFKKLKKILVNMLKSIRRFAKRIHEISSEKYKKARKWYFKNSNITIPVTGVIGVFLVFVVLSVFNTYARIGFNQNLIAGETATQTAWYKELIPGGAEVVEKEYVPYDETIRTFSGGDGTAQNPFQITNGAQLLLVGRDHVMKPEYMHLDGPKQVDGIVHSFKTNAPIRSQRTASDGVRTLYTFDDTYTIQNRTTGTVTHILLKIDSEDTVSGDVYNQTVKINGTTLEEYMAGRNNVAGFKINRINTKAYNGGERSLTLDLDCALNSNADITFTFEVTSFSNQSRWAARTVEFISNGEKYFADYCYDEIANANRLHYILMNDIDMKKPKAAGVTDEAYENDLGEPFTPIGYNESVKFRGVFDGNFHTIKNLYIENQDKAAKGQSNYTQADGLFAYIENATVKNIFFEDSKVIVRNRTTVYDVGTVVGNAKGQSKIYNIGINSGYVNVYGLNGGNSGAIGGIVGYMENRSAVVNCYSYANLTFDSVSRNLYKAGIVGNRAGNISMYTGTENSKSAIVFMLVYYGKITAPDPTNNNYKFVYNGTKVAPTNPNDNNYTFTPTYTYYLWRNDANDTNNGIDYTYSTLKSDEEMSSDGFKAHLNNYRYMANFYVGNDEKIRNGKSNGYSDIAKWDFADNRIYPTLVRYSKTANPKLEEHTGFTTTEDEARTSFGENGYLKVNFVNTSKGATGRNAKQTLYLKIFEKDESNNDFTNHKIILPFNSKYLNFTYTADSGKIDEFDAMITGWSLISTNYKGTEIKKTLDPLKFKYNFVTRDGVAGASKDIGNLYAQGGYYLVPNNVDEITVTTKWAAAVYVTDQNNDFVYDNHYSEKTSTVYGKTRSGTGGSGKSVDDPAIGLVSGYDKARGISFGSDVSSRILVLVGNLHWMAHSGPYNTITFNGTSTGTSSVWPTVNNNTGWGNNPIVSISSLDEDGDMEPDYSLYVHNRHDMTWPTIRFDFVNILSAPQVGTINSKLNELNMDTNTTLEVSETVVTDRIDIRHKLSNSFRLNGGFYNIYTEWWASTSSKAKNYIYFGGNARAVYLNSGQESTGDVHDSTETMTVPILVIGGGRIETLSSTYFSPVIEIQDDVYFFIDGGYIDKFYTTYKAPVNGTAFVEVNGSYINHYYSGGNSDSAIVKNGVSSIINDSRIGEFYGGPEFGSIVKGSKAYITNSVIDYVYGGGYGGTQTTERGLMFKDNGDSCGSINYDYLINYSCSSDDEPNNSKAYYCLGRKLNSESWDLQTGYMAMSYGKAGCPSKAFAHYYSSLSAASVDKVELNIKKSTINKDLYGGGNKGIVNEDVVVNLEEVTVLGNIYGGGLSNESETVDVYDVSSNFPIPTFVSYTVDSEANYRGKKTLTWSSDRSLLTRKDSFGNNIYHDDTKIYSPNVDILGNVSGEIYLNLKNVEVTGSVYGGGNASNVNGNIHLNIYGNKTSINETVYGGGNQAEVLGNIDLRIADGNYGDVFGGGNKGKVEGTAEVTVQSIKSANNIFAGGNQSTATKGVVYYVDGKATNVYGGSNSSGDVDESYVNIGVDNDKEQTFLPEDYTIKEQEAKYKIEKVKIRGASTIGDAYPNIGEQDKCEDRAMRVSYSNTKDWNGYLIFNVTNNTKERFDYLKFDIVVPGEYYATISGGTGFVDGSEDVPSHGAYYYYGGQNSKKYFTPTYDPVEDEYTLSFYSILSPSWTSNSLDPGQTINYFGIGGQNITFKDHKGENVRDKFYIKRLEITGYVNNQPKYKYSKCDSEDNTPEPVEDFFREFTWNVPTYVKKTTEPSIVIENVYGGNNAGGSTKTTNVYVTGEETTIENVYGGGNAVQSGNTNVLIENSNGVKNIYGGGNNGIVTNNTSVILDNATTTGDLFGGGNGVTAVVNGNTSVVIRNGSSVEFDTFGGGNAAPVRGSTNVVVNSSTVGRNVFGGGNGETAIVSKNNTVNILGESEVVGAVFGGGNAAVTGSNASDSSVVTVNVLGGTIGNIYGGANTAIVYGEANVNIGNKSDNITGRAPIIINESVYGGGKSNAEGENMYDPKTSSLSKDATINIYSTEANPIKIKKDIFGSGNAVVISGKSTVNINNLGTMSDPNKMVSIQRTNDLNIYNSALELSGTVDSTNAVLTNKYSMNRIDTLNLLDNSVLFLENTFNLVTKFNSLVTVNNKPVPATVEIDEESKTVTKNVDNRLYLAPNVQLNIFKSQLLEDAAYGDVTGMTFLGIYMDGNDGKPYTAMYDDPNFLDSVDPIKASFFESGVSVMGNHKAGHELEKDGFYSNYSDDEFHLDVKYVIPKDQNQPFYIWQIGGSIDKISVDLYASRYSVLGVEKLYLTNYSGAGSFYTINGFSGTPLNEGVELIDPNLVPTSTEDDADALKTFGLKIKSNNNGWKTDGETVFKSTLDDGSSFSGTNRYDADSTGGLNSFDVYFIHSKNIYETSELGSALMSMIAYTPNEDKVSYRMVHIIVEFKLHTKEETIDGYEAVISAGKKEDLFAPGNNYISEHSQISTYYSVFMKEQIFDTGYTRVLKTSYLLPVNTRITMIDRTNNDNPSYYYYVVTEADQHKDPSMIEYDKNLDLELVPYYIYPLDKFVRMGSLDQNNNFDNELANKTNYNADRNISQEEMLFTFDFSQTNIDESARRKEVLYEVRDENGSTKKTVDASFAENTVFSVLKDSDAKINVIPEGQDPENPSATPTKNGYVGQTFDISTKLEFDEFIDRRDARRVSDTNYTDDRMGLNIVITNSDGNRMSGLSLLGTLFYINNQPYSAGVDGTVRLKVSDFVATVNTNIKVDLTKSNLPTGTYTFEISAFGSPDGLYYGDSDTWTTSITVNIVNETHGMKSTLNERQTVINHEDGLNTDGENVSKFVVDFTSRFDQPNIRVKLVRRDYTTAYSLDYNEVDLQNYVTDELVKAGTNEYTVASIPQDVNEFTVHWKDDITTGTYKMVFELYNGNDFIDSVFNYVFIK